MSFLVMASPHKQSLIIFYIHGGAMHSYKNDKVIVSAEGKISLSTISPTFAEYPNIIGQFESSISQKKLEQFKNSVLVNKKKLKPSDRQAAQWSTVEELHIGKEKISWASSENSDSIKAIRYEFLKMGKQAYKNPIKAMSLECSQNKSQIKCSYKNVGKKTLETVNPLGVSYSVACLDILGRKKILYELKEYNPKKMMPKKIKIKPSKEYKFSIKTKHICDYRVVVKTTDMMINKNYQDVLLGELVSNQLRK